MPPERSSHPSRYKYGEPRLAVVIVSWNTRALLARCLASLAGDVASGLASVYVVDNASSDGSPEVVGTDFPWAQLVRTGSNIGFGRAANRGVAVTATDWIAVANADIEVTPGALEMLVEAGEDDPETGIVAPRLVLPDGSTQRSIQPFPTPLNSILMASRIYRLLPVLGVRLCHPAYLDRRRRTLVDWASGAFLVIRRQTWRAVGGFDERQWMYAEDTDLAWRARRTGWRTRYEPGAVVRHIHAAAAAPAFGDDRRVREVAAAYEWIARSQGRSAKWTVAAVTVFDSIARLVVASGLSAASRNDRWARVGRDARLSLSLHSRALARGDGPAQDA